MTEQDWLTSTDPAAMLKYLTYYDAHSTIPDPVCDGWHRRVPYGTYSSHPQLTSNRKLRLFGCACCLIMGTSLDRVDDYEERGGPARTTIGDEDYRAEDYTFAKGWCAPTRSIKLRQYRKADLFREIVGNPFLKFTVNRECVTPRVLAMAQTIYTERAWSDLPILADLLEDEGCPDLLEVQHPAEGTVQVPNLILSHLRHPGTHVRGCWALDMLLGRE